MKIKNNVGMLCGNEDVNTRRNSLDIERTCWDGLAETGVCSCSQTPCSAVIFIYQLL